MFEVHYKKGLEFVAKQDYKKAIQEFDEALKLSPNYHPALTQRGVAYFMLGQYQKAILDLDRANTLDPQNFGIFWHRALVYFNLHQHQQALQDINEALKLLPANGSYLALKAQIQKAMNVEALLQTGTNLFNQQKYQEALLKVNEAIRLNPNYAEAYCLRGSCYRGLGKLKESVFEYEKALQLKPNFLWIYYNLALTCRLLGVHQQILNNIDLFLKLAPGNASAIALRNEAQNKLRISAVGLEALALRKQVSQVIFPNVQKYFLDMQTKWYGAAANGDFKILQQMVLTYPGTVHMTNPHDRTALHAAAATGQVAVMEFLLNHGANIQSVCKTDGYNVMDYAIQNNQLESLKFLRSKGLPPNKLAAGDYVLFSEVPVIPRITFAAGADDFYMGGGLSFNALVERLEALNMANCNLSQAKTALQDITSYVNALNSWVAERLANYIDFRDYAKPIQAYCATKKAQIQKRVDVKGTVQHHVASKGFTPILEYYIEQGVGLAIPDSLGNTPLHVAAANGHLSCIKVMMEKAVPAKNYCDPGKQVLTQKELINKANQDGLTPLHCAAANGHILVMQYLMFRGADTNAKSKAGLNALDYAAQNKKDVAVVWLKDIQVITLGTVRIHVVKSHEHNNEWLITSFLATCPQAQSSFYVRTEQQTDPVKVNANQDNVLVVLTENAIKEAMKQLDYVPALQRKSTAVAVLGTTSIAHFQESLANPEKQIANHGIKDEVSLSRVKDSIEKSEVKIIYPGVLAAKTARTEWGLAMMAYEPEKVVLYPNFNKYYDHVRLTHKKCAQIGGATTIIGKIIINVVAIKLGINVTRGFGASIANIALGSAPSLVQGACEDFFQVTCEDFLGVPKARELIPYAYSLGEKVRFSSEPFFTLSSSIQSMPIFNKYVNTSTTFQSVSPTTVHCNLPATTLPVLKASSTQVPPTSSTAAITAKLALQPAASLPQSTLQSATLLREKQQTELYYKQNQFTVKQALSQTAVTMTKSPANYGSVASHSVLSSSNNHSVVTSSGGTVTTGNGIAVTTSDSPNYYGGSDRRGVGGDYSRKGW